MTYPPSPRRVASAAAALELMGEHPLAHLFTSHGGQRVTRIPFLADAEDGRPTRLRAHLNGQNPQCEGLDGAPVLVAFSGCETYVSPHWRVDKTRGGTYDYEEVTVSLERTDKADPTSNAQAAATWRLTLKDADGNKLGRAVSDALNELGLATIPGFFGMGGQPARPYGVYTPAVIDPALVPQHVVFLDGRRTVVDSTVEPTAVRVEPTPGPATDAPGGPTRQTPIGLVVGARSGDKGGNANLGVFARSDEGWAWLDSYLTVERLKDLMPEAAGLAVDRHAMPNIRSLNFLIHGLLQEGVAASTRQDAQAKSLGEWLRARHADIPEALL